MDFKLKMESVFSRFESYDFQSDARFQDGLRAMHKANSTRDELLDLKLFFYNRFVEPIDRGAYRQWTRGRGGQLPPRTPSRPYSCLSLEQSIEIPAESEGKTMSFAEVMKLVQEGKDVAGVKKLDIQPTNESPTPSRMHRRAKPWEQSPDST